MSEKSSKNYPKENKIVPPLSSYGLFPVVWTIFTHKSTLRALFGYLKTVVKDFFFLQFSVKKGKKNIPIVSVDHPFDDKIPFLPEKVDLYFGFIKIWANPLSMLAKKLKKRSIPYIVEFLNLLNICYKNAAEFYRFRMSTTRRPKVKKNFYFFLIRVFDPHYMCVPSLHVAIVTLTYEYFRRPLAGDDFSESEREAYESQLYSSAVSIAETVIYIRQHSVNCIPTALYMLTTIFPDLVGIEDCVTFIDSLFENADSIPQDDKLILSDYMQFIFEKLILERPCFDEWLTPMRRWIIEYEEKSSKTRG